LRTSKTNLRAVPGRDHLDQGSPSDRLQEAIACPHCRKPGDRVEKGKEQSEHGRTQQADKEEGPTTKGLDNEPVHELASGVDTIANTAFFFLINEKGEGRGGSLRGVPQDDAELGLGNVCVQENAVLGDREVGPVKVVTHVAHDQGHRDHHAPSFESTRQPVLARATVVQSFLYLGE